MFYLSLVLGMKARRKGRIVCVSSQAGQIGLYGYIIYSFKLVSQERSINTFVVWCRFKFSDLCFNFCVKSELRVTAPKRS